MKALYSMVGMKHRGTEAVVAAMQPGFPLLLIREPDNPHDRSAIAVFSGGMHVAYVKGTEAQSLARAMDAAGKPSIDAVFKVTGDRWPQAEADMP